MFCDCSVVGLWFIYGRGLIFFQARWYVKCYGGSLIADCWLLIVDCWLGGIEDLDVVYWICGECWWGCVLGLEGMFVSVWVYCSVSEAIEAKSIVGFWMNLSGVFGIVSVSLYLSLSLELIDWLIDLSD